MSNFEKTATPERIEICRADRELTREEHFKNVKPKIGREAVTELRQLYDLFSEQLYIWYASLWDPEIGGFYFSESGRDGKGFLPDIESTMQALNFIEQSGLSLGKKAVDAIPESMRRSLTKFVKSLEDPDDGYFYHPQWGKNIVTARRGRDLSWSIQLLEALGEKPDHPTAPERLASSDKAQNKLLPAHFSSLPAWESYLLDMFSFKDPKKRSHWVGGILQAQVMQIKAAGDEYIDLLFNILDERQLPLNGLWEPEVNYGSVNCLMKFSLLYSTFGRSINHVDAAMLSAINAALSNDPITACCNSYNPLATINFILMNLRQTGRAVDEKRLYKLVLFRAPELIRNTKIKLSMCKRSDGGFSYNPVPPFSQFSQKAPVGLGLDGSDVNASSISAYGCIKYLCELLGIPIIPLYGKEDAALFYELIENAYVHEKIYEKPDWFDDAIDPEKLTETY